jgi:hypothetical protein
MGINADGNFSGSLLDFFLDVNHIDKQSNIRTINTPTPIPISTHNLSPNMEVFLDS